MSALNRRQKRAMRKMKTMHGCANGYRRIEFAVEPVKVQMCQLTNYDYSTMRLVLSYSLS